MAALNGDQPNRLFHLGFSQLNDPGRELLDRRNRSARFLHELVGPRLIEAYRSSKCQFRIQSIEREVRVGNRGLLAATVADRPGFRAGRLRPGMQNSSTVK